MLLYLQLHLHCLNNLWYDCASQEKIMMYLAYETGRHLLKPYAYFLKNMIEWNNVYEQHLSPNIFTNFFQAKNELMYEFVRNYEKPEFGFTSITKDNIVHQIEEKVIVDKTFCSLKLFQKSPSLNKRVPLLIVAPLSGHYATLLRDTVKASLYDYDVYITDWKNCRDIALSEGDFGFDDYVNYVMSFIETIKKTYGQVHVMAVCQPTVPVLCATALMAKTKPRYQPDTVILMGGPIDTTKSPTQVNNYALDKDINWFKNNVIHNVPHFYPGMGRSVYPGFFQYSGFVAMNLKRHTQAHVDFFNHLMNGADLNADKHRKFYNEYNAVMDLPAKYYLETIERVFIDQYLAKDKMVINGVKISLKDITNTRLITIEGELDDISGPGQTHVAVELCENLASENKKAVTIPKVGHYGIFAGRTWREVIYPQVKSFIEKK